MVQISFFGFFTSQNPRSLSYRGSYISIISFKTHSSKQKSLQSQYVPSPGFSPLHILIIFLFPPRLSPYLLRFYYDHLRHNPVNPLLVDQADIDFFFPPTFRQHFFPVDYAAPFQGVEQVRKFQEIVIDRFFLIWEVLDFQFNLCN